MPKKTESCPVPTSIPAGKKTKNCRRRSRPSRAALGPSSASARAVPRASPQPARPASAGRATQAARQASPRAPRAERAPSRVSPASREVRRSSGARPGRAGKVRSCSDLRNERACQIGREMFLKKKETKMMSKLQKGTGKRTNTCGHQESERRTPQARQLGQGRKSLFKRFTPPTPQEPAYRVADHGGDGAQQHQFNLPPWPRVERGGRPDRRPAREGGVDLHGAQEAPREDQGGHGGGRALGDCDAGAKAAAGGTPAPQQPPVPRISSLPEDNAG